MRHRQSVRFLFLLLPLCWQRTSAQQDDSLKELLANTDTKTLIDSLMIGFDDYLDSILNKQNHFHVSLGVGSGLYSIETSNKASYINKSRIVFSPAAGFMHKIGFGINAAAFIMADEKKFVPYMGAIIPSYDLIKRNFSTGVSFSKYIVKDSLNFYTTPINNELYSYFTYKKWWLRPTLAVSYGWGSEASYNKRKIQIKKNRKKTNSIYVIEKNIEQVSDLSLLFSVRKDFSFFEVLSKRDMVCLTPVILFRAGTQQYGFNSTYSYEAPKSVKVNNLPTNNSITDRSRFLPESAAMILRASYLTGNWVLQPQFLVDYYLPGAEAPVSTAWSVTAGWSF